MTAKSPRPDELEPIERASRDELAALQLSRLRWTLQTGGAVTTAPRDDNPHVRAGLTADGSLKIATRSGDVTTVQFGEVRLRPV